jgi:tetratricopeptide (TPR) repeat protein
MDRGFYFTHYMLGQALELKGQLPEAMAEYQQAIELNDDPFPKALLGHLFGKMGRKDEARTILEELRQVRGHRYFETYGLALLCLGLDDRDGALRWLEQGYRDRDGFSMGTIRVDPFLDPLHGDPRFAALAEKIVPEREFGRAAIPK